MVSEKLATIVPQASREWSNFKQNREVIQLVVKARIFMRNDSGNLCKTSKQKKASSVTMHWQWESKEER